MKLVIDISDEHYRNVCKRAEYFGKRSIMLAPHEKAIVNGTPLEEELEKIKAKINLEDIDCQYEDDYEYSGGLQKAIEIIDNRIAELKGE